MDILLFVAAMLVGITAGTITGLIPGIHVNLIASFLLILSFTLRTWIPLELLVIVIIAMSITHTFIDFLPSILIGVPDSETALSVLPAHRLVHEGRGYHAIVLSAMGSLGGMAMAFLIGIPLYFLLATVYEYFTYIIPWLLSITLLLMILLESGLRAKLLALITVCFAGGWGMLVLQTALVDRPLLVLFTGLFGVSALLVSLYERPGLLPAQLIETSFSFSFRFMRNLGLGGVASTLCSVSPGLGNAQAGTLASLCYRNAETEDLLIVLSAINTITFLLSFLTFYLIDKTRTGTVAVISQLVPSIPFSSLLFYAVLSLFVGGVSCLLTLYLGRVLLISMRRVNTVLINAIILIFLGILIPVLTNIYGLLIMVASAALGFFCLELGIRRVHLMATLIVPVIWYFL